MSMLSTPIAGPPFADSVAPEVLEAGCSFWAAGLGALSDHLGPALAGRAESLNDRASDL
jgi:hypothetical protein